MNNLTNYTYNNTDFFSLENNIIIGRIVDIYDGDTCTCIIPFNNNYYKFHVRLNGIDTYELKSKNIKYKNLAVQAKKKLSSLILNFDISEDKLSRKILRKLLNEKCYLVKIKCGKFDKYGRLLAYLFNYDNNDLSLENSFNNLLLNEKLAYVYNGDTKENIN